MASPALSETITLESGNILNVNMSNVTKLSGSNFLMWSRQIHALLNGYGLAQYIDGTIQVPPPTITTDGVVDLNPAFTSYQRQDQLLYSALLGLSRSPSNRSLLRRPHRLRYGRNSLPHMRNQAGATSSNFVSRSNNGRRVPSRLMSTYKALRQDLINWRFLAKLLILKIKLSISLTGYLTTTNSSLITSRAVTCLPLSLRFMRSYSIMRFASSQ